VTAALEIVDVVKTYPGEPPVVALDTVSLRVDQGEMVGIVGPSGSGKTTLLHIIGTLDRPTSGEVLLAGVATANMSDRQLSAVRSQLLGFVFQQFFLLDGMSALDNVANGLLYRGVPLAARRDAAREALERVGLANRLHHIPNKLSGGERQRVALARAIVNRPAIVLADEPTGNLDSATADRVLDLFADLAAEGRTVLMVTHERDVSRHASRQITLLDGRILDDRPVPARTSATATTAAMGVAR
jgi:putative ABC transport system ATP-binding protein